jgi:hypothetical protein
MFQDLFLTIVAAYVLFKILGEYSERKQRHHSSYPPPYEPPRQQRTNNQSSSSNKDIEGEYVDYEEIK